MRSQTKLAFLGDRSPREFLARHWQRRALHVKQAIPDWQGLFKPRDLLELAYYPECRSRLVLREGKRWRVETGPFKRGRLRALGTRNWALLVQDVNLVSPAAQDLLMRFNFIPYARMDDLMVSLAPEGGGVGPHFDSYDVFLLQGSGRRRWALSTQKDLSLVRDAPLRLLKNFQPGDTYTVDGGDMLYLPPKVAHDGVALEECMTYSIGFRAPRLQELLSGFLAHLDDESQLDGLYEDPDLLPTASPARIPAAMIATTHDLCRRSDYSKASIERFLGKFLTDLQPHVRFSGPDLPLTLKQFSVAVMRHGIELDLRTRMLRGTREIFINGEPVAIDAATRATVRALSDRRALPPGSSLGSPLLGMCYQWYRAGYLLLGNTRPEN